PNNTITTKSFSKSITISLFSSRPCRSLSLIFSASKGYTARLDRFLTSNNDIIITPNSCIDPLYSDHSPIIANVNAAIDIPHGSPFWRLHNNLLSPLPPEIDLLLDLFEPMRDTALTSNWDILKDE